MLLVWFLSWVKSTCSSYTNVEFGPGTKLTILGKLKTALLLWHTVIIVYDELSLVDWMLRFITTLILNPTK